MSGVCSNGEYAVFFTVYTQSFWCSGRPPDTGGLGFLSPSPGFLLQLKKKTLDPPLPTSNTVKLLFISSVAKKNKPKNPEEKKTKQRAAVHIRTTYNGGKQAGYQVSTIKCEHK